MRRVYYGDFTFETDSNLVSNLIKAASTSVTVIPSFPISPTAEISGDSERSDISDDALSDRCR